LQLIACGFDDFELEPQFREYGAALSGYQIGLSERECAAARGDDDWTFNGHFFSHR